MIAKGKREARRPWIESKKNASSPGKGVIRVRLFQPFRPQFLFVVLTRGDALRAYPGLSYCAPLALWLRPHSALWPMPRFLFVGLTQATRYALTQ
jgi:hypothetical protein